jgi:hypothetical protein
MLTVPHTKQLLIKSEINDANKNGTKVMTAMHEYSLITKQHFCNQPSNNAPERPAPSPTHPNPKQPKNFKIIHRKTCRE